MTRDRGNFNKTHPELRDGEVFLTNVDQTFTEDKIKLATKRVGEKAYLIYGKEIPGARPVFVQKEELEKAGRWL